MNMVSRHVAEGLAIPALALIAFQPQAPGPDTLAALLERAAGAVSRYAGEAAVIIAEERCTQRGFTSAHEAGSAEPPGVISPTGQRRWRAEVALARTEAFEKSGVPWIEIRDVVEADGRTIPDREERLQNLLLKGAGWTAERARAMLAESARFNIGPVGRNTNTPATALLLLYAANQRRFTFTLVPGTETVDGVRTAKVTAEERGRPTLIRRDDGADAPASAMFWIEPASGEVLRSRLRIGEGDWKHEMTVTFLRVDGFRMRLPATMAERTAADDGVAWVEAKYTYSKYRRFETGARLLPPK